MSAAACPWCAGGSRHSEWEPYCSASCEYNASLALARAEGEAAGRAAVWRHIADAPRDGSRILLFFPEIKYPARSYLVAEGFFDVLFDKVWLPSRGGAALLDGRTPTHWAPLPEPPADGGAR